MPPERLIQRTPEHWLNPAPGYALIWKIFFFIIELQKMLKYFWEYEVSSHWIL